MRQEAACGRRARSVGIRPSGLDIVIRLTAACRDPRPGGSSSLPIPTRFADGRHASLAETREALDGLADRGVAVVLWGNETRAEMELIRADLDVRHPFVSESGGGLFLPVGYFAEAPVNARAFAGYDVLDFGRPYPVVAAALHEVANKLRIGVNGFSGMSVQDVANDCRLSLAQARLATLREYRRAVPYRGRESGRARPSVPGASPRRLPLLHPRSPSPRDRRHGQDGECPNTHVSVPATVSRGVDGGAREGPRRARSAAGGRYSRS